MAIEALYPSRRQSHWTNPLFVRPLMCKLRRATFIVAALAATAIGLWCLNDGVQPRSAPVAQQHATIAAG